MQSLDNVDGSGRVAKGNIAQAEIVESVAVVCLQLERLAKRCSRVRVLIQKAVGSPQKKSSPWRLPDSESSLEFRNGLFIGLLVVIRHREPIMRRVGIRLKSNSLHKGIDRLWIVRF